MAAFSSPIQVPLTTGVVRSFGHTRLVIAGLEFTGGYASFKLSRTREREMVMSNSPDPVGKTLGENKYQASVVLYYDWFMNLLFTLQNNFGPGYGDIPFTMYPSFVGANLNTYTDTVINCTFDTTEADNAKGVGALTREIQLNPTKILFGGIDDLAVPLVAPPQ
jgi:hypothetical protein